MTFAVAAVVTVLTIPLLIRVLRHRSVLDIPNARSSHDAPTPRGGGIAVMGAVVLALVVGQLQGDNVAWPVVVVAVALAVVGFVDDLTSLGGLNRLTLQVLAAVALLYWSGAEVGANRFVGAVILGIALVAVVGYVNAFNFMDGINGISALNAALAGCWFAWLGHEYGIDGLVPVGLAVAGAAAGFLPWNAPSAKIFLGDVGSYGLGFLIVGMGWIAFAHGAPVLGCVAPLVIYGMDTALALLSRAFGGRSLIEAHREHVYQRLVDAGWSHLGTAIVTVVFGSAVCAALWRMNLEIAPMSVIAALMIGCIYLAMPTFVSLLSPRTAER